VSVTYSQAGHLQFKHLTKTEGLSSSDVLCVLQDYKGYMWIGTYGGLNRYDGLNFIQYLNNPSDSSSLSGNYIRAIFEDHNKNLFIGSNLGLSLYNRDLDCFVNYIYDKSSTLYNLRIVVRKITEDSTGNLWLATDDGLVCFNRLNNKVIRYRHNPDDPGSIGNNSLECSFFDRSGRLWITASNELDLLNPETGTFEHITQFGEQLENVTGLYLTDIIEDRDGNIWFGSTKGLFCLENQPDKNKFKLVYFKNNPVDPNSISNDRVKSLFVDDDGNLWIGTENGGINLYNRETNQFLQYRIDEYDPMSLNNESIQAFAKDRNNNLWVSTYGGGVNISVKNSDFIIHYRNLPGAPQSLSYNIVSCFFEDHFNRKWIGTDGGGLNLFNDKTGRFTRFNIKNSGINSNAILCMAEGTETQMWIGTWAGGLVSYNYKSNTFKSLTTQNSKIPDNSIYAVVKDKSGNLWLGSFEHGLIYYQLKENKFFAYTQENSAIANARITVVRIDNKGQLYLGATSCLQVFNPETKQFITYTDKIPDDSKYLSNSSIYDILVQNDTTVWIATSFGLDRFNPVTGSFKKYYKKDGLPDNTIFGLILDKSGILWLTTNAGVCRFDYIHNNYKNFTTSDGIQGYEFYGKCMLRTKNDNILAGGHNGFNIISPEKFLENKNIPEVIITDFYIFNKPAKIGIEGSPLKKQISETKKIILTHKQSVLTFYFSVMDFTAPGKNQYAYMMERFDKDWIYSGNKREATYTNLNPGEYVFHVKGSNNDGVWNETGTSIFITILCPWWSTWWFRLIAVSAIIFAVVSIVLSRVRSLKNQKKKLERLVVIKTSELQELNVSKDKFFSIIAHDLKNPFQTIIGFSEMLKEEMKDGDNATGQNYAGLINTSAIQTFRLLENLLEWANSQRGKVTFSPVSINLRELVNEEFGVLNDMAKGKNIELKSSFDDNLTFTADKNMINTILRNLISNAIKFTHKNGKVELKAIINNKQVEISVSDNGIGMKNETMAKLFRLDGNLSTRGTENEKGTGLGLFLCKEFVEKHGGRIWVESEEGKGSTFKLLLPLDVTKPVFIT